MNKKFNLNLQHHIVRPEQLNDHEWDELVELILAAFAEHAINGLTMMPCSITREKLKSRSKQSLYFLGTIEEKLVGVIIMRQDGQNNADRCGYLDISAVQPSCKRMGIGRKLHAVLEQHARENLYRFLYLDTSCKAHSSQSHHKANGYKPWFYTQFSSANYRSIVMRKDLEGKLPVIRRYASLIFSWCKMHLWYTDEGTPSWIQQKLYFLAHPSRIGKSRYAEKLSLRDIQQTAYNLLVFFDQFCQQHQLRYFLCYGSLIGAVRHKGFIPWDDDIDVTMPLPDYTKFIELMEQSKENPEIGLLYGMKGGAGTPFAMLTDERTVAIAPGRDIRHTHPVAIDIFPAYALSDNKQEAQQQIDEICRLVQETRLCYKLPPCRNIFKRMKLRRQSDKNLRKLLDEISAIIHRYPWGSTKQIRLMSLDEHEYLAMRPDEFEHFILHPFESGTFRIPVTYHEHLSELYGNYMELPPIDKRYGVLADAYQLR